MTAHLDSFWRLAINHRTVITYPEPVTASYNEVRMQPANGPCQSVLTSWFEIDPYEGIQYYTDYFGTSVASFDVHRPHLKLTVSSSTTVETFAPRTDGPPLSWEDLVASGADDRYEEYLAPTALTALDDELITVCSDLKDAADSPADAAQAACEWVKKTIVYERGATTIHTSATEAYRDRRGVCQDLTHVAIGVLRCMGIPARYVSGYLHPNPEAEIGTTVEGDPHAWVEYWDGAWRALDSTTAAPTGRAHVVAGRGRDYRDTPPIRGVYAGRDAVSNDVTVQITRLR